MATRLGNETRSLPAMLAEIVCDLSDLVRQEIALAKTEVSERLSGLQLAVVAIATGGAVALSGFIVLLDACVYALGNLLGPEIVDRYPALPALIVGLSVAIIGVALIKSGAGKFSTHNLRPSRTLESLRHDRTTVEEHLK